MEHLRRHPVVVAAALAFLARLPALTRPLRADEAGFLLVARAWDPQPGSMFGPYWVDRPPSLIAIYRAVDELGGAVPLRLLGAVVALASVLLAAAVAHEVAGRRAVAWTAAVTAALLSNPMIDVVAVKGELLALPFLLGSVLFTLQAVRRTSVLLALGSGLAAGLAVGLKQNLVTGLVFAAVLLLVAWRTGRLPGGRTLALATAAAVGAAVPAVATVVWARIAGVRSATLWEAVYGFRTDAARVIADGSTGAPEGRAWSLLAIALACGLLPIVAGLFAHLREVWPDDRAVVAATVAVATTDLVGLAAGGSFWRDYLTPLVPGAALCVALLAGRPAPAGRRMRGVVAGTAASAAAAMVFWASWNATGQQEFHEVHTGEAVAAAAERGDTLVVFGGRADLQDASGLGSPYPYLWSLPMRARDPGYDDLRAVLTGPDAPTWLVEWAGFGSWRADGAAELERVVEERYAVNGVTCNGHPVYLLRGLHRPSVDPDCG